MQLLVRGHDRKYFLSDVTRIISDTGANIVRCATRTLAHVVEETFWIDVHDSRQLQRMVKKLRGVEGVTEVQRVDEAAVGTAGTSGGPRFRRETVTAAFARPGPSR